MAMSSSAIRAGAAFVEVLADDSKARKVLKQFQAHMQSWGSGMQRIGMQAFALGSAMTLPFVKAVQAASRATEIANKFGSVFGREADAASEFVKKLARDVGRSSVDIQDSISAFMAMFQGMGFDTTQARMMSQSLQALALDFSSFFNVSDSEGVERFISALSGSSEVVDRFGINLKVAAINQKLLEMGISKSAQQATEQEKVMARYAIIMESLGRQGAINDAVRTSGSFANMMKRLQGNVTDLAVAVGSILIPAINPYVTAASRAIGIATEWVKKNKELTIVVFKTGVAIAGAGAVLLGLSAALSLAATAVTPILGAMTLLRVSIVGTITVLKMLRTALTLTAIKGAIVAAFTSASAAVTAFGAAIMAIITNPLALLVIAIVAAGAAFVYFSGLWDRLVKTMGATWKTFTADAKRTWETFVAVLKAGRLDLLFRVGVIGVKLAWIDTVEFLEGAWDDFCSSFTGAFDSAVAKVMAGLAKISNFAKQVLAMIRGDKAEPAAVDGPKPAGVPAAAAAAPPDALPMIPPAAPAPQPAGAAAAVNALDPAAVRARLAAREAARANRVAAMKQDAEQRKANEAERRAANLARIDANKGHGAAMRQRAVERVKAGPGGVDLLAPDPTRHVMTGPRPTAEQLAGNALPPAADGEALVDPKTARDRKREKLRVELDTIRKQAEAMLNGQAGAIGPDGKPISPRIPSNVDLSAAKTAVQGTFSAHAAAGFGAGNTSLDRIAMYSEQTAKNTKDLKQKDGLTFG